MGPATMAVTASEATWALALATYNRGDMVYEAIPRALGQTEPPTELVVIDASDDGKTIR